MKKIITIDDFRDVFIKAGQRGWPFILSKFNLSGIKRTKSAFGKTTGLGVNWWQVPYVQQRWNKMITGNKDQSYLSYLTDDFFKEDNMSLISFGSGNCMAEIELAKSTIFNKIVCVELSETLTMRAREIIEKQNLKNIVVECTSIYDYNFSKNAFDIVLFKSSLHHFKNIESLLKDKVIYSLKQNGYLLIDECVAPDRLQYSRHQLRAINKALKTVPKKFRKISGLGFYKNKVYGPGIVRMILADPSECVESSQILPSIRKYFNPFFEKPYGGNILASVLKDIAHHFNELDEEKKEVLDKLFKIEDKYLETNQSDFIFGIYTIKK